MGNWYAIETKPKGEDKAERDLRLAGFTVYAPIAHVERWNKRKKVHVERTLRLMPRYLFVSVELVDDVWLAVRSCRGVSRALGADGLPCRLNSFETKALEEVMQAERDLEFDTTRAARIRRGEIGKNKRETARIKYPAGSKIRITKGPFASFSAEVTTVTGRGKLEALVSLFGRLSTVEIPAGWAEIDEQAKAA